MISSVGLKPASSSPSSHIISYHLILPIIHLDPPPSFHFSSRGTSRVAPPRRSQDCICPFGIGLDSMGAQSGAEVYVSQSVRQVVATSRNRSCESLAPSMPVEFSAAETEQGREQRGRGAVSIIDLHQVQHFPNYHHLTLSLSLSLSLSERYTFSDCFYDLIPVSWKSKAKSLLFLCYFGKRSAKETPRHG